MTKDEKAMFARMMEILERIEARLTEHEISPAMEAALTEAPTREVCIDVAPEEVEEIVPTPAAMPEPETHPITKEELAQVNKWLVDVSEYLQDEGALVRGVLSGMGFTSLTDVAADFNAVEELKRRVTAGMAGNA